MARATLRLGRRLIAPFLTPIPAGPRSRSEAEDAASWWAGDARWYPRGAPPRRGNRVTALVDGRAAMLAMYRAMRGAETYILISDWSLTPDMEIVRGRDRMRAAPVRRSDGTDSYRLDDLLADRAAAGVDVRVLLWQGLLFFRPRRHLVYQAQGKLSAAHPDIQVIVDATEPFGASHHQKFVVVDGRVAFVSGLDFTDFDADRWDTSDHPVRRDKNWHDVTCRLEGPCVEDVQRNFAERWRVAARSRPPALVTPPPVAGSAPVQIVRTIPARTYPFARRGEEGIAHGYHEAIARAERFIYIENQYLWSPDVVDTLIERIERAGDEPFQVAIVLPMRPNIGKTDTDRQVRRLLAADRERGHVHVYALYTWGRTGPRAPLIYKPIYMHAKLMIVDDDWLTMGSANLNTRSLDTDTELNTVVHDAEAARRLRLSLWSEHLIRPAGEIAAVDPVEMLGQRWPRLARAGAHTLRRRQRPLPSHLVPYPLGVVLSGVVKGRRL